MSVYQAALLAELKAEEEAAAREEAALRCNAGVKS
jgi:hypothetical protein